MNLQELKDKIREDMPEYVAAIEKITKAAVEDKESYVDFMDHELPDAVRERLSEDGYNWYYNKFLDYCFRVYGWAGDVEHP
jgi:hypothetical protein